MGIMDGLALGCNIAFSVTNLFYCFIGVFIGTLIGVLPGIGPVGTIALLLPVSFGLNPVSAIIFLAGIYYGAQYGGSTTSILVSIPGEAASVVTVLDGYQMAKQGRAGPALGIAAFGSFIAGTIGIVLLMLLAVPLSKAALLLGPPELVAIMVLGLTIVLYLARGSMLKAIIMAVSGFALGQIGTDLITGQLRFTFGVLELENGVALTPLVMGLFGISEILISIEKLVDIDIGDVIKTKVRELFPNLRDWKDSIGPILRGSFLGFFIGMFPGPSAIISSFTSYAVEKKVSKHPEKFGTGAIEGVAGPESANNSATAGAFIPLFTLGIPFNVTMGLLLGALMIHGVEPGPLLMKQHPEIFWGTVISMYIGNAMLLVLNLPLIGLWIQVLKIPNYILLPLISLFCLIGSYSVNNSVIEVFIMLIFGIIGYIFRKYRYEPPPLVLAFILEPIFEKSLRRSLIMSHGSFSIFFSSPIAGVTLIIAILLLFSNFIPFIRRKRQKSILAKDL